jgi:hypothetical protein
MEEEYRINLTNSTGNAYEFIFNPRTTFFEFKTRIANYIKNIYSIPFKVNISDIHITYTPSKTLKFNLINACTKLSLFDLTEIGLLKPNVGNIFILNLELGPILQQYISNTRSQRIEQQKIIFFQNTTIPTPLC